MSRNTPEQRIEQLEVALAESKKLLIEAAVLLSDGIVAVKKMEEERDAARDIILIAYNEWQMGDKEKAIDTLHQGLYPVSRPETDDQ